MANPGLTTIERRMRAFALTHIVRCGSDTEARRAADAVLEQRCQRCHRAVALRVPDDADIDVLLAMYNATPGQP
jgi:hypothetical protein